jgi:hypothetical protein
MYKKNFKDFCYGMSTKKGALNESKVAKNKNNNKRKQLVRSAHCLYTSRGCLHSIYELMNNRKANKRR